MVEDQIIVVPIQIRPDVVVRIHIPANLTKEEAEKIGRVVRAMVSIPTLMTLP